MKTIEFTAQSGAHMFIEKYLEKDDCVKIEFWRYVLSSMLMSRPNKKRHIKHILTIALTLFSSINFQRSIKSCIFVVSK